MSLRLPEICAHHSHFHKIYHHPSSISLFNTIPTQYLLITLCSSPTCPLKSNHYHLHPRYTLFHFIQLTPEFLFVSWQSTCGVYALTTFSNSPLITSFKILFLSDALFTSTTHILCCSISLPFCTRVEQFESTFGVPGLASLQIDICRYLFGFMQIDICLPSLHHINQLSPFLHCLLEYLQPTISFHQHPVGQQHQKESLLTDWSDLNVWFSKRFNSWCPSWWNLPRISGLRTGPRSTLAWLSRQMRGHSDYNTNHNSTDPN